MEWQSYRKKAKKEYLKDVAKYDEHIEVWKE